MHPDICNLKQLSAVEQIRPSRSWIPPGSQRCRPCRMQHWSETPELAPTGKSKVQHTFPKHTFHSPGYCWGSLCRHRAQQEGSASPSSPDSSSPRPLLGSAVFPCSCCCFPWWLGQMKTSTMRLFQKSCVERDKYLLGNCTGPSFLRTGPVLLSEGDGWIGRTMPDQ